MTSIKLCLVSFALTALLFLILATPALAQAGKPHVVRIPPVLIKAKPCTTRALDQGSGSVRICG